MEREIAPKKVSPLTFGTGVIFSQFHSTREKRFGAGVLGFGKRNRGGEILLRTHLGTNMAAHTGLGGFYFDGGAGGCTDSRKFCFEYNFSVAFPKITSRDFLGGMGLGIRSYF